MGSAEGLSPFAGSLRVSLRYNFFPFITRKGARGMFERVFQRPASGRNQRNARTSVVGCPERRSPFGGGTGGAPQNSFSPFQKGSGTGGKFGAWQITSASPMRGRHYDAVLRSQVPSCEIAPRPESAT